MHELGYYGHSMTIDQSEHRQHQSYTVETAVAKSSWTSARCNRLLRPLSSKIALLRKEIQTGLEPDTNRYASNISAGPSGGIKSGDCHTDPARAVSNTDIDSEWESNPRPRKKIKRTYSGRARTASREEAGNSGVDNRANFCGNEAVISLPPQLTLEVRNSAMAATMEITNQFANPLIGQNARDNHQSQVIPRQLAPNNWTNQYAKPLQELNARDNHHSQGIPRNLAPSNWKLMDGICKGLIALLKATNIQKTESPSGCRSLFSTCLRQAPKYIAEEEVLSKAEDPDNDVDVSSVVYNDLENFGTMPGGGWEPLAEVVRAHGIKLVTDAIEEDLIGPGVARHLFDLCLDNCAYDEAHCIVESMIALLISRHQSVERLPKYLLPGLNPGLDMILNSLQVLASRSGRQGLLYLRLSAMLDQGTLPIDWISSKPMIAIWNEIIQSIAQEDGYAESAAILLRTAVNATNRTSSMDVHSIRLNLHVASHRPVLRSTHSGHAPESAPIKDSSIPTSSSLCQKVVREVHSTVLSVLTVLSAITRLRIPAELSHPNAYNTLIDTELHRLSVGARQTIDLARQKSVPSNNATLHADSLRLPLLAAGLVEITSSWHSARSDHTSQHRCPSLIYLFGLPSSNETLAYAGSFLCAVARCCGRARSEDPFEVIQVIVQGLIDTFKSIHHDTQTRKSCEQLAFAAAFAFSEDTSRPSHLDWALQVELTLTGRGAGTPKPASIRTPARNIRQPQDGYRWEEGICEWIAKTPNLLLQKASNAKSDIVHVEESFNGKGEDVERGMPLPPEISPCAASRKPARSAIRTMNVETEASHVLVPAQSSSGNRKRIPERVSSINASKRTKTTAYSGSSPNIYEDNDLDELAVPESSQEDDRTRALSIIQIPSNASLGNKRNGRKRQLRDRHTAKISAFTSRIPRHHHDPDISDDELAGRSRW